MLQTRSNRNHRGNSVRLIASGSPSRRRRVRGKLATRCVEGCATSTSTKQSITHNPAAGLAGFSREREIDPIRQTVALVQELEVAREQHRQSGIRLNTSRPPQTPPAQTSWQGSLSRDILSSPGSAPALSIIGGRQAQFIRHHKLRRCRIHAPPMAPWKVIGKANTSPRGLTAARGNDRCFSCLSHRYLGLIRSAFKPAGLTGYWED